MSVEFDAALSQAAFALVRVAQRPAKPRETGLTIVADRGMGTHQLDDLLETSAPHLDWAKIAIGAFRLQTEAFVRAKVERYHAAGVRVFFAGDVTEAAYMQGVSGPFYRAVRELGGDGVEVSSAQVAMPLDQKCELIRMAKAEGLSVIAEAGQKGHEEWTGSFNLICGQIEGYFRAGAWRVLIQGEGTTEGVAETKESLLLNLAARFGTERLIFQAKDVSTQAWYVGALGNDVNLDVDDHQVLGLELMRRGIRKRGLFGLVGGTISG